jgi:serine protease Do
VDVSPDLPRSDRVIEREAFVSSEFIRLRRSVAVAGVVTALGVGGALTGGVMAFSGKSPRPEVTMAVAPAAQTAQGQGQVSFAEGFAPVVARALPAVVNISSSKKVKTESGATSPFFSDPFFRQFFGNQFGQQFQGPRERLEKSLGSGVIVSPDGYILTNNHVVEGATDVKVSLSDKREFKAKIIGTDKKTDIAVLKIEASGLPTLVLGDSDKVRPGEFVLAIGDPFGVGETVTMGIVSATGRGNLDIEDYEDFIQTDAAINPGNSGGALIDTRGELVGINTAILAGGGGGNQGIGFAIPINLARQIMGQILKTGHVVRGYLGVLIQPVTPGLAKAFGLSEVEGALVGDVNADSPASRAGLQKGDVIVALNGVPVRDSLELRLKVAQMAPGTDVKVGIVRNGEHKDVTVKLGELKEQAQASPSTGGESGPLAGVKVENLTPDIANQIGVPPGTIGVVIDEVASASPAAQAGLARGDVIEQVNHQPVPNAGAFDRAVREADNKPVLLLVNHQGATSFVVIEPE